MAKEQEEDRLMDGKKSKPTLKSRCIISEVCLDVIFTGKLNGDWNDLSRGNSVVQRLLKWATLRSWSSM